MTVDRRAFAAVLTQFLKESGASFDQVADYLVAVSASPPPDDEADHAPGWFFRGVCGGAGEA